jgi:plastocyanin
MKLWACAVTILISLASWTGAETIEGKVEVESTARRVTRAPQSRALRKPDSKRDYPDRPSVSVKPASEESSVVVWVVNPPNKGKAPTAVMRQRDKMFVPYVLPVVAGTKVEFPNDDSIYHGVYSESGARPFELPQYANGESRSVTFDKPGVVELFCHIHAHMNAFIVVLESGYFDMPNENHRFSIAGLPPGSYKVKAWHPRLGSKVQAVEVKAGSKATVDFKL